MKKSQTAIILLIATFVLLRLLLISSQRDSIFDPNEFISGTIAMELIHGLSFPLKYCVPDNHNYGSVVNGILIVPFYLLFGPSTASAKMVSILFSLGTLIFWYLLLDRFFNHRVAVITSLLFIFSPIVYTKSSVLSVGAHPETTFFTAITMFILYLIFFDNRKKNIYFALLGLVSGFGFFYSYLFGVTLLVVLIFWFVFDRRFVLRPEFYIFLIFLLIGFSPRLYFTAGFKGAYRGILWFTGETFRWGDISFDYILFKTRRFLINDMVRLFDFRHPPFFFRYLYYSLFLISTLLLLQFKNKCLAYKEALLLVFPFVFSMVYILSRYAIFKNWSCAGYIVPLYPFIFVIIAVFFERLMRAKYVLIKILSAVVLCLILLAGLYGNIDLIGFKKIGQGFIYKGYSYRLFGERVSSTNFGNKKFLKIIKNMEFPKRQYFLEGFGWSISSARSLYAVEEDMKRFSFSKVDRLHYFKGMGRGLAHLMSLRLCGKKDTFVSPYVLTPCFSVFKHIAKNHEEEQRYFWEGFGQGLDLSSDTIEVIKDHIEDRFKPYLYQGLGDAVAEVFSEQKPLLHEFDSRYRKYIHSAYSKARSELLLKGHI
ncbi:ArnT family glycosyltransferase [Candidatus Omnitrophota bacterium]